MPVVLEPTSIGDDQVEPPSDDRIAFGPVELAPTAYPLLVLVKKTLVSAAVVGVVISVHCVPMFVVFIIRPGNIF
jgi:hypothetical protein